MNNEKQLARLIFRTMSTIMKSTLNLEEMSYREQGRDDPRYKTFKKYLMETTYTNVRNMLEELAKWGLIDPTGDGEDISSGFSDSLSGGAGYLNSPDLDDLIEDINSK